MANILQTNNADNTDDDLDFKSMTTINNFFKTSQAVNKTFNIYSLNPCQITNDINFKEVAMNVIVSISV